MSTFIDYTVGIMASGGNLTRPRLVKAEFNTHKDGVQIKLVDANSLNTIRNVKAVVVSNDEFENRSRDHYNDTVEARWAFSKLGLSA